jgi:hypothetical protein
MDTIYLYIVEIYRTMQGVRNQEQLEIHYWIKYDKRNMWSGENGQMSALKNTGSGKIKQNAD